MSTPSTYPFSLFEGTERYVYFLSKRLVEQGINVVDSFETIEHLKSPLIFLSEAKRILKEEGNFICSTPNKLISLTHGGSNPFHVKEFYKEEFRMVLKHYFFDINLYG